jgi:hypothetical protein
MASKPKGDFVDYITGRRVSYIKSVKTTEDIVSCRRLENIIYSNMLDILLPEPTPEVYSQSKELLAMLAGPLQSIGENSGPGP